jgi:hypothetical protein
MLGLAPGRMIDNFQPIPNAESLPLYRMVLKLACVCVVTLVLLCPRNTTMIVEMNRNYHDPQYLSNSND